MPLSSIPYLESKEEKDAFAKRRLIIIISTLIAIILAVIGFNFLVMPLDVFWYKLLRVISNV